MLFSSVSFIYLFLPIVLMLYFASPKKLKNAVLLLSSLAFYFMGEPIYILLLLFSSVSDYTHSLFIEKYRGSKKAKAAMISSVVINLLMLGFFKYADFFIESINTIFGTNIPTLNIPLPIGISFFTFQTMSYSIDVYRGAVKANRNIADFGTYVCLFPQLIAGPIVRYSDVAAELDNREHSAEKVSQGILRFTVGLGKKVIIANLLAEFTVHFRNSSEPSVLFYWLYAVSFFLQVYFDFSGYSDMAIGMGKMFGFHFPENFNYPIISKSLSEFWRRWHQSLGAWFRDYVYFPLGGSRVGKIKLVRNLFVVWLLTGLWHGAAVNFVLWGLFFFVMLSLEKLFLQKALTRLPKIVSHIYTCFFVLVSFVIFGAENVSGLLSDLKGMFSTSLPLSTAETAYYFKSYAVVFAIAIVGATPLVKNIFAKLSNKKIIKIAEPLFVGIVLIICTALLISGSFNPFLYFRF